MKKVKNVLPSWDVFGKPNFFMTRLNKDSLLYFNFLMHQLSFPFGNKLSIGGFQYTTL
jgi:hypothetical protein